MAIEQHTMLLQGIIALLSSQSDIRVVSTATSAIHAFGEYMSLLPDVVIVDLHVLGALHLIRRIQEHDCQVRIIPLVGYNWEDEFLETLCGFNLTALPVDHIDRFLLRLIRGSESTI